MSIGEARRKLESVYASESADLAVARRVLATEREGLDALTQVLDVSFSEAVDVLARAHKAGRVIVTGMGKSGHIARKIAATLASTGSPASHTKP